jgi:hypothetical protein
MDEVRPTVDLEQTEERAVLVAVETRLDKKPPIPTAVSRIPKTRA